MPLWKVLITSAVLAASLAFPTAQAQDGDTLAFTLRQQAQALNAQRPAKGAMNEALHRRVDDLLEEIARTEAMADHGQVRIGRAQRLELRAAAAELAEGRTYVVRTAKGPPVNGTITGVVVDSGTLAPLASILVRAVEFSSGLQPTGTGIVSSMSSAASGTYTLTLPPGNYTVRTNVSSQGATGYRAQVHDGQPCDNSFMCTSSTGTVIALAAGATVSGIDFELDPGAAISGTVTRASDGVPLAGVSVRALAEDRFTTVLASTDAAGAYTIRGAAPGRYRVNSNTDPGGGLIGEAYANRPCDHASDCRYVPVDWITVASGSVVTGIDLSLDPASSIAGTVNDATVGGAVAGADVSLVSDDGFTFARVNADAGGAYVFTRVRPGTYRVLATGDVIPQPPLPPSPQLPTTHIPVVHPGVFCSALGSGLCDPVGTGTAIVVPVAGTAVTGIDFALDRGGTIQGNVRSVDSATPIPNVTITAGNVALLTTGRTTTDASGNYAMGGIPPGTYTVQAFAIGGAYASAAYGVQVCRFTAPFENTCSLAGTPVTIAGNDVVTGVDIDMALGGTITGTIIDAETGAPAPANFTRLELYDLVAAPPITSGFMRYDAGTGTTNFTVTGVPPGAYAGVFASSSTIGAVDVAFGGVPCARGTCDRTVLPSIFATAGATLSGINGTIPRGRVISGRVTDAATGIGVELRAFETDSGATPPVAFSNAASNALIITTIDGAGGYTTRNGLPAGTTIYPSTASLWFGRTLTTFGLGYIDQNFGGGACPFGACGAASGMAITLGSENATGIDFAMVRGGSIAGTALATAGGAPIIGADFQIYDTAGRLVGREKSNTLGAWRVRSLPPGDYFVATANAIGYLNEVYPNISCEPFCNPLIGSPVTVTGTATTGGIDFSLDLAAAVSGTVNAANVPVEIYGAIGNLLRNTTSAANGSYAFTGLAAGTFYVRTRNTTGQADELWSGEPCVGDACNIRRGTPVVLAAGANATNRDLTLAAPGVITGQVTRQNGGAAQSGVMLQLLAASGAVALTTTTNGTGNYTFSGLAAGDYYLVTRGTPGLIDVSYPSTPCPAACNGLNGSSVAVTAGTTLPGVNIQLQDAGYISGSVKTGGTVPVVGAVVQAYNTLNVPTAQIATNASGNYQLDGLSTGQFYVRTQNTQGLVDQVFKAPVNLQCSGFCDVLSGTQVAVNAGSAIPLPDFNLAGGAIISGRVSKASDGSGIALATVLAYDNGGNVSGVATANANGDYTIGGLRLLQSNGSPAGYYLRTANLSGFVNQLYKGSGNLSCSPTPCSNLFLGTKITVSVTPTAGINFALAAGSVISGTATDQFNNPLPTGTAVLYDGTGTQITTSPIDRGLWQFAGLANGTYYVLIQNNVGLVDQLYANVPCPGGACSITTLGTPIVLSGGAGGGAIPKNAVVSKGGVATIDLKLGTGQTIAGTVLEAGTDVPLAGVTVYFFSAAGAPVGQATTDGLGEYLSDGGFGAGTYYAATANGTVRGGGENILGAGYVNRLYAGQNCLLACNVTGGTPITVAANPVMGIDFTLGAAGAGITGTVRDAQNQPLEQTPVEIYGTDGRLAGTGLTNSLGVYSVDGLPAGNYYARTRNNAGLQDRLYGQQLCAGVCNPLLGTPIAVPAVAAITGIDINLSLLDGIFANGFEN